MVLNLIAIPIIEINRRLIDYSSMASYQGGVVFAENENSAILVFIRSPHSILDHWVLKRYRGRK
jgi:hypothetical protein